MSWDIIGHEWAVSLLKSHIQSNVTRHAYLFTGAPGIGRRTLALQFVQALNCLNPPAPGEFCGECRICKQVNRLQHPDLYVAQAEEEGGILKIDTVREILHVLNMRPFDAKWRIAIFERFEEANQNSQNALLKTLEEPPDQSKLFLTASNENAILPTITSRCEVIRLRPMPVLSLSDELMSRKGLNHSDAERIAKLSSGRVGLALSFAENPEEVERIVGIARDALVLLGQDKRERFHYAENFRDTKKRGSLREILRVWELLFRDILLLSASFNGSAAVPIVFQDLLPELRELSAQFDTKQVRVCTSELGQMINYLNANVNLQMLMENLFLDWPQSRII